jgi:hypothetical protein
MGVKMKRDTFYKGDEFMKMKMTLAAFLVVIISIPGMALAGSGAGAYYYDGGNKIAIVEDAGLMADFTRQSSARSVKKLFPTLEKIDSGAGGPQVYKVQAGAMKMAADSGAKVAPVYRQGGRMMSLPGGVIVTFNPSWSDAQANQWAVAKGYEIQQKLNITGNWYIIKTAPGLDSLNTANAIQESGEVVSASPNWWVETAHR